ncbi:hypothetical protein IV203_012906 [Nitzschia inconspicua]|uniref:Uncharacterized protein n=1 Tax=Nitzschia inconspicua TaxID=303405 RepID=A0A9K3Q7L4_9STRA|nr:hypothetical protein IV203_012906 [Nitzschia inconspicua]
MVAASASGSTLMLDCISDEVVGNWFGILCRMNRKSRMNIFRGAVWGVYQQLQRKFLYPAQAALEELEASIGYGDHEAIHNETLRERVKEAVNQSMDVKLSWMLAGFGVLMQVLWMNLGLLPSSLLGNLDDNRGKKKIETIQR